jgi:hypothetical protein
MGPTDSNNCQAVIKHLNINVPANLESDHHVYTTVKASVSNELMQTRSKIKKAVSYLNFHPSALPFTV